MRHADTALRLRRAFRATAHAARRIRRARVVETMPAVAHIVADLDDLEGTSEVASALAWRRRALFTSGTTINSHQRQFKACIP